MIDAATLRGLLASLATKKPLFCSEMDFQLHLAWEMKERGWSLSLEHDPSCFDANASIEILIESPERVAVELKYKTALFGTEHQGRKYALKNHSAEDTGRYDFIKDVSRVETVVRTGQASRGYAIFLTNHPSYWLPSKTGKPTIYDRFRLHETHVLHGALTWTGLPAAGLIKGREQPIGLSGSYMLDWIDYSKFDGRNGQFRYLLVETVQTAMA